MSSKERRKRGHKALSEVTRYVFDRIEVHAKGFDACSQAGYSGEWQRQATASAEEILRTWYAIRELPKNVRKPYEVIDRLLDSYLHDLGKFANLELEAANVFLISINPNWRDLSSDSSRYMNEEGLLISSSWEPWHTANPLTPKFVKSQN